MTSLFVNEKKDYPKLDNAPIIEAAIDVDVRLKNLSEFQENLKIFAEKIEEQYPQPQIEEKSFINNVSIQSGIGLGVMLQQGGIVFKINRENKRFAFVVKPDGCSVSVPAPYTDWVFYKNVFRSF